MKVGIIVPYSYSFCGGVVEHAEEQAGALAELLVRPGDPDRLADAILALLADEARWRRLGAAARELGQSRYAWPALARQLRDVHEELVPDPNDQRSR